MMISFMWLQVKASHFDGLITTILGYILLAGALIVCHVSFIYMKLLYVYEITYSMPHISSCLLWLCITVEGCVSCFWCVLFTVFIYFRMYIPN